MARQFINQLSDGKNVNEDFVASEKQLRPNRAGNLYLQLRLSDKTGSLTGMMWNANQRHYDSFDNGDFVRVQGTSQVYNGGLQIIAKNIVAVEDSMVDEKDFTTITQADIDQLWTQLSEMLRT